MKISTQDRANDYLAIIEGTSFWETGLTEREAIANLVIAHGDKMDLSIKWSGQGSPLLEKDSTGEDYD